MLYRDFARAVTAVVLGIVDDAELARGYTVNGGCSMNHITTFAQRF
jgi:NH3-dependent NAD+ synthetase